MSELEDKLSSQDFLSVGGLLGKENIVELIETLYRSKTELGAIVVGFHLKDKLYTAFICTARDGLYLVEKLKKEILEQWDKEKDKEGMK